MKPPKHYITREWKYREGFTYKQPYDYCNGVEVTYKNIPRFKEMFGVEFSTILNDSKAYDDTIKQSMYHSGFWTNKIARDNAFLKIQDFNKSGKSGTGSSVTPLLPFEIFMMNDGFEMVSFAELNAINPCLVMHSTGFKKKGQYEEHTVKMFYPTRLYKKEDKYISLKFGFDKRVNFYFTIHTKENPNSIYGIYWDKEFQVDNNPENYEKAINGQLKSILK